MTVLWLAALTGDESAGLPDTDTGRDNPRPSPRQRRS